MTSTSADVAIGRRNWRFWLAAACARRRRSTRAHQEVACHGEPIMKPQDPVSISIMWALTPVRFRTRGPGASEIPLFGAGKHLSLQTVRHPSQVRKDRRQCPAATIASVIESAMPWWRATRMPGFFGLRLTAWKRRKPTDTCATAR